MAEPRLPSNTVDPRAKWYWFLSSAITLVIIVAVVTVPALIWEPVRPWFLGASAVILVLGGLRVAIMPALRYRVHRWEVSDTAVYAKSGWLSREWKIAPLSRIQTVEAKRNPLHQLLGLASVSVTTGSSYGAIVIQGLAAEVAEEVVADLTESTQHTVGDAT